MPKHLLSVADLDVVDVRAIIDLAITLKREPSAVRFETEKAIALVLQRPSLRTRTAYEVAMMHLGGRVVVFEGDIPLETASDTLASLGQLVSGVALRMKDHSELVRLATRSEAPFVNALSNREHPVEVLADAVTMLEVWGSFHGRRLCYVGNGNNICHSLLLLCALIGLDIAVATPPSYEPDEEIVTQAKLIAERGCSEVLIGNHPVEAATGADAIYTDVWPVGGVDAGVFQPYQVNAALLSCARPDCIVLHCLPARRGEEITTDVLDGPRSLAFKRLKCLVPVTSSVLYHCIG